MIWPWMEASSAEVGSSFASLCNLAGGDLPGHGYFRTIRGRLSFRHNRDAALELYVGTDEVDGRSVIICLDVDQVQELRRLASAWLPPPVS